jgi:hypothetical protein
MRRVCVINARDPKIERLMNRLWIRIKTGKVVCDLSATWMR